MERTRSWWRLITFLFSLQLIQTQKCDHGCIWRGKADSWEEYEHLPSLNQTYPPKNDNWRKPATTLYISIASFRDKLCPHTLVNIFTKAAYPARISVGVVQQNAGADPDCLETYCELIRKIPSSEYQTKDGVDYAAQATSSSLSPSCPFRDNIRMKRVDATEAKGPTWARALASQMLQDEEFCMQTDAHMDFMRHWDEKMMNMWAMTNNEYAILSTYVTSTEDMAVNMEGQKGINGNFEVPHLCMVVLSGEHGMVRNWGTKCMRNMATPKLTNAVWGAGLSYSKCHAERKAPYDPHTPHIFDGEEFSRAMRFWTWGYDIYTPHRVYVVHNYKKSQSDPLHMTWTRNHHSTVQASVLRLQTLLDMPRSPRDPISMLALHQSRFGLGDRRTLDQGIQFSGVDTKNRKILGNRCGNLDFVPFMEHPWGADYVPRYESTTAENEGIERFLDVRDPGSIYFDAATMTDAWQAADAAHKRGSDVLGLGFGVHSMRGSAAAAAGVAEGAGVREKSGGVRGAGASAAGVVDTLMLNKNNPFVGLLLPADADIHFSRPNLADVGSRLRHGGYYSMSALVGMSVLCMLVVVASMLLLKVVLERVQAWVRASALKSDSAFTTGFTKKI